MTARCDTFDILLFLNTKCRESIPCVQCYQYRNCQNIVIIGVYRTNFKKHKFESHIFEDYMIYTDGETP